jgi:hypothetical protein
MVAKIPAGAIAFNATGQAFKVLGGEEDSAVLVQAPSGKPLRVPTSRIARWEIPATTPKPPAIQIGDRLRRLPAKRTTYPAGWFGKDAVGNPLADIRPSVSELVGTVTGFAPDGYKVRTIDGRNFRVSHEAIEFGEWMRELGQNN